MKFAIRSTWRADVTIDTDDEPEAYGPNFDPRDHSTWPTEVWEQITTQAAELVDWETTWVVPE